MLFINLYLCNDPSLHIHYMVDNSIYLNVFPPLFDHCDVIIIICSQILIYRCPKKFILVHYIETGEMNLNFFLSLNYIFRQLHYKLTN